MPRTENLAVDWLQLTKHSAMLILPLHCSVTENPLKGTNMLVSLILFMKHGITNIKLLAFSLIKLLHFDCVSHEFLLSKLELRRVAGIVLIP